jgi:hypothetical protein
MSYKKYPKPIIYTEGDEEFAGHKQVVVDDFSLWYDPEFVDFDEAQSVGFLLQDGKTEEFWDEVYTLPKAK